LGPFVIPRVYLHTLEFCVSLVGFQKTLLALENNLAFLQNRTVTRNLEQNRGRWKQRQNIDFKVTMINRQWKIDILSHCLAVAQQSNAKLSLSLPMYTSLYVSDGVQKNIEKFPLEVNHGHGRMLMYLSRVSQPLLSYCLFPLIILWKNHKMRKTIFKELKNVFGLN